MPRKERIEYAGAIYHVFNRGDYRKDLFADDSSQSAFESCLFEVVERCGWKLHAYVLMSNHYHLAIETPQPNLVAGMRWLQSTFATRFNRSHNEGGNVFQGRYKAIIIGSGEFLLGLVDYIHLNPVRDGLCAVENLKTYTPSSYPKYFKKSVQSNLHRKDFLSVLGEPDSLAGIRRYKKHLELREEGDPKKREELAKRYCRGWFIGEAADKKALEKDLASEHPDVVWEGAALSELNKAN